MPRNASLAQIEASRQNGRRSHGPITSAGKARAALNARTFGLRSTATFSQWDEDPERFQELQDSVHDEFRPSSSLEAALCARMVAALWRSERAERLEASYWLRLPRGCQSEPGKERLDIVSHDTKDRRPTLDTIMRYLGQAQQAYARAFRQLQLLREGRADPAEDALFVTSDLPPALHAALEHQAAEDEEDAAMDAPAEASPDPVPAVDEAADRPPEGGADPQATPPRTAVEAVVLSAPLIHERTAANDPSPRPRPSADRPDLPDGQPVPPTLAEICTNEPELAQQWLWKEVQAWMASR